MLLLDNRFPKGEKLSPSPSAALLWVTQEQSLEHAERSDSSIEVLFSPCPCYLAQSLADRLDGF
jgi:hypothetical protein